MHVVCAVCFDVYYVMCKEICVHLLCVCVAFCSVLCDVKGGCLHVACAVHCIGVWCDFVWRHANTLCALCVALGVCSVM